MGHILTSIFENSLLFIFLVIIIASLLLCQIRRFNLGLMDSINFFWVFTFGTSYAVVIFLYLNDYILGYYFYIIFLYYIIMSIAIWFGSRGSVFIFSGHRFSDLFNFSNFENSRFLMFFLVSLYLLLLVFYVSKLDFSVFFISRFEANSGGLGIISRYMDVLRLFILSYVSIIAFSKKSRLLYVFLVIFAIASSFINGAKFAILESIYVMFISVILYYSISLRFFTIKKMLPLMVISLLVLIYVAYFLDRMASGMGMVSSYTDYPIWVEALLLRIIANGDMYYLSLPESIIDSISIRSQVSDWLTLFIRPLVGGGVTESLTGSQESISVGRAIWLYHYPDSLSGGSVEHFDLDAYIHFGLWYGILYVLIIGIYIGFINKVKMRVFQGKDKKNILFVVFFSYIYNKSYILLLSPTAGFSLLFDGCAIISIILLLLSFIQYIRIRFAFGNKV